jgi:hypothetical protein
LKTQSITKTVVVVEDRADRSDEKDEPLDFIDISEPRPRYLLVVHHVNWDGPCEKSYRRLLVNTWVGATG